MKNQKSCGDGDCPQRREDEARKRWRGKTANRSYFCGRYEYLKSWLQKPGNRGYLKRYRKDRRRKAVDVPPTQRPDRALRPPGTRTGDLGRKSPDIQDALPLEIGSETGPEASITS